MLPKLKIPKKFEKYLRIGTSSWKYDGWKGLIYDPDKKYKPQDYLADYSRYYNTVEIDQWFWSLFPTGAKLPNKTDVKGYAESVPDDFLFTVKVPNAVTLTHYYAKQTKAYLDFANKPNQYFLNPDLFKHFLGTLAPFDKKLGPVMFQFEYLNKQKMPSRKVFLDKLHAFLEKAPKGYQYAIESRNPNYLTPDFFEFLSDHQLGFVLLDGYYMPPIKEVIRAHNINTASYTVMRLQGKDRQEMEAKTDEAWNQIVEDHGRDIQSLTDYVQDNVDKKILTIININNHYEGCAPLTIQRIADTLFH
jgi:uncharacterized protein YecE (DUF72 family)